jgi:nitroreductase
MPQRSPESIHQLESFLNSHYSVRHFSGEPISEDLTHRIIKMSRRAPTSSNLQMCSILTVRDSDRKSQLAELCGSQKHIEDSDIFFVFLADLHPLHMLCSERGFPFHGDYLEPFVLATVDASLCAGRALTGAQALGLGGVLVGGIRNEPQSVAELLELPDYCYAVCGMSLGWPVKEGKTKPRIPDSGMHHQEKYRPELFRNAVSEYDNTILETGLYQNRNYPLPSGADQEAAGSRPYSWSEHSARRISDGSPGALRVSLRPFLEKIGFKLK